MPKAAALPAGTVTFLFTDIEGSTRLVAALGAAYGDLLDTHRMLLRDVFGRHGGTVVGTEGDSFFVAFESPVAAVAAAADAQRALFGHRWPEAAAIKVRMGVHTGLGVVRGDGYIGLDVHRAARISAAGNGGQVVLSQSTAALVDGHLADGTALRPLGRHRLKDLGAGETLYQLDVDGLPQTFPPLRTLEAVPHNLPVQLTTFVGRADVLAHARELLGRSRILTLTGPGGTGKTRLALQLAAEVASSYRDGTFFVPLAPVEDPALIAPTVLGAMGISVTSGPETPDDRLARELADRRCLMVLDNFEQLLEGAPVVARMVQSSPASNVMVTSRAPLAVSGEQELPVPPLPTVGDHEFDDDPAALLSVDAVQLFTERATGVRPDFELTHENAPVVARLVERLDGLPLAIELAASRVKLLSPDQILERLDARTLSWSRRDLPERQQTLWKAIDWSHELLSEPEQRLFAELSVFVGGARLDQVEKVCLTDTGSDLIDGLASLVDHSLLVGVDDEAGARYRMLHVIREYAAERLESGGTREATRRAHALAYLELSEGTRTELVRGDRKRWLDLLEAEHDNIRAALNWALDGGEADVAMRLAYACWRFWQARGHLDEARTRITKILSLPGGAAPCRARAFEAAGGIDWWRGDAAGALASYRTALETQRSIGDPAGIANALYNMALVTSWKYAESDAAEREPGGLEAIGYRALLDEAEGLYAGLDDDGGLGDIQWARATIPLAYERGAIDTDLIAHLERAIEHYGRAGNEFGRGWALYELANAQFRMGQLDAAEELIADGLRLFASHDDVSAVVVFLFSSAAVSRARGDEVRALTLAGTAHRLSVSSGAGIAVSRANAPLFEGLIDREQLEALTGTLREAYRAGRALSLEEAIAYALGEETAG